MKELYDYSLFCWKDFAVKFINKFICSVHLCFVLETGYFEGLRAF